MTQTSPVSKTISPARRISDLMRTLQGISASTTTEDRYHEICAQVLAIPAAQRPASLLSAMAEAFGKPVTEVSSYLRSKLRVDDFEAFVPKTGWIRDYIEYTRKTEPPTVFHFFVSAVVIGATLGRRVFFDKGAYQVFPNLCVMLLAPSGRCRKTSAANLGAGFFMKSGGNLLADKTTPESFVDTLKMGAQALIYAPELAVFLGKQKYNEGMVPLLTALFDCPEEWRSSTIGRGETVLQKVALSALMCSTVDWLQSSVPPDVFGGGFMSRFLFVVQEYTDRCFPKPPPLNQEIKKELTKRLTKIRMMKGEIKFSPEADAWYDAWYRKSRDLSRGAEKQFSGYYERKPDHMLRIAMILRVSESETVEDLLLRPEDLQRALRILNWLEEWLPGAFDQLASSSVGEDQTRILRQLRQANGALEHSSLLRKNSSRLNAEQFRRAIGTLREAKLVEWEATTKTYLLTPEGWG
jgi:hypothetical protein